jgi:hypothetical protein
MRPEANRSTPSLLSQTSPTRRSSNPLVHQINGNSNNDLPRRNGPASINTSPARSTLSLTSTVNLHPGNLPASTTTTPGKVSTPIYYDYTEEFDVKEYAHPTAREPPPQFRIESTIPEDHPTTTEQPQSADSYSRNAKKSLSNGNRTSSSAESIQQIRTDAAPELEPGFVNGRTQWPVRKASLPPPSPNMQAPVKIVEPQGEKKVFRVSRLGYVAQELNSHVAEAFELAPSESFEMQDAKKGGHDESGGQVDGAATIRLGELHTGRHVQQSSQSPPTEPSRSRNPHEIQQISHLDDVANSRRERNIQDKGKSQESSENPARICTSQHSIDNFKRHQRNSKERRAFSLDFTSARTKRPRSSCLNSVDTGFTDIAELISSLENANRAQSPENKADSSVGPPRRNSRASSTIPDKHVLGRASSDHNFTPPISAFNQQRNDSSRANTERQQLKQVPLQYIERRPDVVQECGLGDVPNFSHQIPRKSVSRSGSPMLAPKPISPSRQLKLKNSVPQLMKSLPPTPQDPPIRALSPPEHMTSEQGLPFRFSPLNSEVRGALTRDLPPIPEPDMTSETSTQQGDRMKTLGSSVKSLPTISTGKRSSKESSTLPPSPPRLKLKVRSTAALSTRASNSEENSLEPNQNQDKGAPVVQDGKLKATNPPKFKLKITRASNSSQGTVRINRESVDSKALAGLRNPKDLFTPAGIDNIFRHAGRHLHSRKSSANSSHTESGSVVLISSQVSTNEGGAQSIPSHPHPKATQLNSSDVRSFFSDASSNLQGHHSLRKRLSNFKTRIAVPYSSRVLSQSFEDIPLRSRTHPEAPRSPTFHYVPNLHGSESSSTEDTPLRNSTARAPRRNLREKLSRWLKGARSAIAARVRSRNPTGEGR